MVETEQKNRRAVKRKRLGELKQAIQWDVDRKKKTYLMWGHINRDITP